MAELRVTLNFNDRASSGIENVKRKVKDLNDLLDKLGDGQGFTELNAQINNTEVNITQLDKSVTNITNKTQAATSTVGSLVGGVSKLGGSVGSVFSKIGGAASSAVKKVASLGSIISGIGTTALGLASKIGSGLFSSVTGLTSKVVEFGKAGVQSIMGLNSSLTETPSLFQKIAGVINKSARFLAGLNIIKRTLTAFADPIQRAFDRLDIEESFQRKMKLITGDAENATWALDQLRQSTTGTPYGLDIATKAVQNFVTRGLDTDKAVQSVNTWMDAVSSYGKGTNEELETVLDAVAKMRTKGTVEMKQLNRLFNVGINPVQIYAEAVDAKAQDVQAALTNREISSKTFVSAVEKAMREGISGVTNISGQAKKAATTWQATFDNMKAAITRGTQAVIVSLNNMLEIDGIKKLVKNYGVIMENGLKGVASFIDSKVKPVVTSLSNSLAGLYDQLFGQREGQKQTIYSKLFDEFREKNKNVFKLDFGFYEGNVLKGKTLGVFDEFRDKALPRLFKSTLDFLTAIGRVISALKKPVVKVGVLLFEAFGKFSSSFLPQFIDSVTDKISRLADFLDERLPRIIDTYGPMIEDLFMGFMAVQGVKVIVGTINDIIGLGKWLVAVMGGIPGIMLTLGGAFLYSKVKGDDLNETLENLKRLLKPVKDFLDPIIYAFKQLGSKVITSAQKSFDKLSGCLDGVISRVTGVSKVSSLLERVGGVSGGLGLLISYLGDGISGAIDFATEHLVTFIDYLTTGPDGGYEGSPLQRFISAVGTAVLWVDSVVHKLKEKLTELGSGIKKFWTTVKSGGSLSEAFGVKGLDSIWRKLGIIKDKLFSIFSKTFGQLSDMFGGVLDKIFGNFSANKASAGANGFLNKIIAGLSAVDDNVNPFFESIKSYMGTMGEIFAPVIADIKTFAANIAKVAVPKALEIIRNVMAWIDEHKEQISKFLLTAWQALSAVGTALWNIIYKKLEKITGIAGKTAPTFLDALTAGLAWIRDHADFVAKAIYGVYKAFSIFKAVKWVIGLFTGWKSFFTGGGGDNGGGGFFSKIMGWVTTIKSIGSGGGLLSGIFSGVNWTKLASYVGIAVVAVWALYDAFKRVKWHIDNIKTNWTNTFGEGGTVPQAMDQTKESVGRAGDWISEKINWVKDKFYGAISWIGGLFDGLSDFIYNLTHPIEWISNTITGLFDNMVNTVKEKLDKVRDTVNGWLPSWLQIPGGEDDNSKYIHSDEPYGPPENPSKQAKDKDKDGGGNWFKDIFRDFKDFMRGFLADKDKSDKKTNDSNQRSLADWFKSIGDHAKDSADTIGNKIGDGFNWIKDKLGGDNKDRHHPFDVKGSVLDRGNPFKSVSPTKSDTGESKGILGTVTDTAKKLLGLGEEPKDSAAKEAVKDTGKEKKEDGGGWFDWFTPSETSTETTDSTATATQPAIDDTSTLGRIAADVSAIRGILDGGYVTVGGTAPTTTAKPATTTRKPDTKVIDRAREALEERKKSSIKKTDSHIVDRAKADLERRKSKATETAKESPIDRLLNWFGGLFKKDETETVPEKATEKTSVWERVGGFFGGLAGLFKREEETTSETKTPSGVVYDSKGKAVKPADDSVPFDTSGRVKRPLPFSVTRDTNYRMEDPYADLVDESEPKKKPSFSFDWLWPLLDKFNGFLGKFGDKAKENGGKTWDFLKNYDWADSLKGFLDNFKNNVEEFGEDTNDFFRPYLDWLDRYKNPKGKPSKAMDGLDKFNDQKADWLENLLGMPSVKDFLDSTNPLGEFDVDKFRSTFEDIDARATQGFWAKADEFNEWLKNTDFKQGITDFFFPFKAAEGQGPIDVADRYLDGALDSIDRAKSKNPEDEANSVGKTLGENIKNGLSDFGKKLTDFLFPFKAAEGEGPVDQVKKAGTAAKEKSKDVGKGFLDFLFPFKAAEGEGPVDQVKKAGTAAKEKSKDAGKGLLDFLFPFKAAEGQGPVDQAKKAGTAVKEESKSFGQKVLDFLFPFKATEGQGAVDVAKRSLESTTKSMRETDSKSAEKAKRVDVKTPSKSLGDYFNIDWEGIGNSFKGTIGKFGDWLTGGLGKNKGETTGESFAEGYRNGLTSLVGADKKTTVTKSAQKPAMAKNTTKSAVKKIEPKKKTAAKPASKKATKPATNKKSTDKKKSWSLGDWLADTASAIGNSVMDWLGLGQNKKNQPKKKGYATGTKSASRGVHWVGEKGPELMMFKGGEQVINHKDSVKMVSQAGKPKDPTTLVATPQDHAVRFDEPETQGSVKNVDPVDSTVRKSTNNDNRKISVGNGNTFHISKQVDADKFIGDFEAQLHKVLSGGGAIMTGV